ncbi:MAG: hypothetical protein MRY57_02980 [Candidatus Pacebacteria bacterium]|nr:hypothetical protein [Candidatus Paceibacterota bacterium]
MKKLIFICSLFAFLFSSCSPDEECVDQYGNSIDCDYYEDTYHPDDDFAEGDYLRQLGSATISGTVLNVPIETKNISTSNERVDVVIFQNGEQLSGGPWVLNPSGNDFYRDSFDTTGDNPINGASGIEIDLYVAETNNSPREYKDTLYIN